jgi:hypothetical protein
MLLPSKILKMAMATVLLFASAAWASPVRPVSADLIVYGGTASGVMTAYAAAREGLHVVLLEPGSHLGGMVTGGLSATDAGNFHIIGGYVREFYREAAAHYGRHSLDTFADWRSEPHVDEQIFNAWMKKSGVEVHFHERLRGKDGVAKRGTHIVSITTEDGRVWRAAVFADCTYEGDLMAQAGVSYTVGRESRKVYGEELAGVRAETPHHQFLFKFSPYGKDGKLLPGVSPGPLAPAGSGDKKVQAYNFRLILTNDPANKLPWAKRKGYDASQFELLARYLQQWKAHEHREPTLRDVLNPVAIPNHKADFNNQGAFSTDYIGESWSYPDASYAERRKIWDAHLLYTKSLFWFLASDPRVPKPLRDEMNRWGIAKDEFADTGHWPDQLYIREGRRMIGQYVMHQADLQTERTKRDSIAMGSYNSDSHNVERIATPDGGVLNEGNVEVPVRPYEIAYRAILPRRSETDNLLVPVCLSASHVAYSSIRMEPQYMMIGEAAGTAASMAVKKRVAVSQIDAAALQQKLRAQGAVLHLSQEMKSH